MNPWDASYTLCKSVMPHNRDQHNNQTKKRAFLNVLVASYRMYEQVSANFSQLGPDTYLPSAINSNQRQK